MLRSVSLASALSRPQPRALSQAARARIGITPARGLDSTLLSVGSMVTSIEGLCRHGTLQPLIARAFSSRTGQMLLSDTAFRQALSKGPSNQLLDNLRRMTGVNVSRTEVRRFTDAALDFANNPKGFGQFGKKEAAKQQEAEEEDKVPKKKKADSNANGDDQKKNIDFNSFFSKDKKKSTDDDDDDSSSNNNNGNSSGVGIWIMAFIALLALSILANQPPVDRGTEMTFQQFRQELLARGNVKSITVVDGKTARVYTNLDSTQDPNSTRYFFHIGSVESFERSMDQAQRELGIQPLDFVPIRYSKDDRVAMNRTASTVINVALLAIPIILIYRFSRNVGKMVGRGPFGGGGGGGGPFGFGRAKPVIANKETKVTTTFADVAGLDEAKLEVMEFVKFLKSPGKFTKLGAKLPKGALLVGPPGTGKTLLARATAGESGVPFFSMSGSDFQEMYVGVGPARVRDLFKQARASAPCIVFIDEIDAVGRKRGKGNFGGNEERENTLNQLLVEMDGFKSDTGVVVLGGTNRSDILDPALLRPGRFDRQILVDKPDIRGRRQIFEVHLKKLKLADPISELAQRLSALTPGFAGADIANICNEAAIIAARHNKDAVELVDFEAATDRVIGGLEKKNKVMTQEERRIVAYHEAGHAVAGWFFEHADPLLKVTIVPRGAAALGYAQYLPQELNLYRENQIIDKICMALGGRVAEQIFFSHVSTGAADDLKKVTSMAYNYVGVFGMSERLPHLSYPSDGQEFQKPYSEKTAEIIDEEVGKLVKTAYNRTVELLSSKKALIDALATRLLKDETINHDVIVSVLGPRPFETQTYTDFVRDAGKIDWTTGKPHEKPSKGSDSDGGSGGSGGSKSRADDSDSNKLGPEGAPAPVAPSSSQ